MLRILSWNIQQGGGSRVLGIGNKVRNAEVQIAVLSEFRNNASGIQLRSLLLRSGFRYQSVSHAKSNENSVLIASSYPHNSQLLNPNSDDFAHGMIDCEFDAFHIMGAYMPHKKKHNLLNMAFNRSQGRAKPSILCGDLNTGINGLDQKGDSFWYEKEVKNMLNNGFIDAFRHKHEDRKEYSWFSHQGNGYRYDHTFVQDVLKDLVHDCYYLHEWRKQKLSDHSPMILELS